MNAGPPDTRKLYQQIARTIAAAVEDGRYAPGDKLPSERELADDFGVSRPTIRDAMIALEFQGLVEARQGSGVYVKAAPQISEDASERDVSALELAEARRLFEGEACALAAAMGWSLIWRAVLLLRNLSGTSWRFIWRSPARLAMLQLPPPSRIFGPCGSNHPAVRPRYGAPEPTAAGTLWASIARLPLPCALAIRRRPGRRCMATWRK
jgi:DNA-binding transcriptional regulator YhcF (GntR family)